jgi:hypothetical protein
LGERDGESEVARQVGGDLVVAAAQILHERRQITATGFGCLEIGT